MFMEIIIADKPVPYEDALSSMEARVEAIYNGRAQEQLWFLEHPPLYTAGTSAKDHDLLEAKFPVYEAGRGGQYTYHGPGQRVVYSMLDLRVRQQAPDIKRYIWQLEEWIIKSIATFGVMGERREGRIGIWVDTDDGEAKIAAIGVRIRHWISFHGIAVNVSPDLSHYEGIVPCGLGNYGVTSLTRLLGAQVGLSDLDEALLSSWADVFEVEDLSSAA
jgi:lipoyl(octanoyl) transferase